MDTSNTYFTLQSIHYSTIDSPEELHIRATAQHPQSLHYSTLDSPEEPRIRATAQFPQGLGLRKTPYTTLLVFPALWLNAMASQLPRKGRVSPVRRKGLTLLPRIVRRPQHLPPGRQLRSPKRSTHFLLSSLRYAGLFRTRQASLPDSTAQLFVLPDRSTILLAIHHRPLVRLLIRNLHSRNYINPRNTLVNLNTISKRLYLILKHVYSLQEYTPNSLILPATARGHHP